MRTLLFGVYVPAADLPDDPRALREYEETFPGHVLAWMQAAWHGDHAAHGLLDGLEIEGEVPQGRDRPGRPREALADRWGSLIALERALLGRRTLALPATGARQGAGTESLFVLQGPPGTGKTMWITEPVVQILTAHMNMMLTSIALLWIVFSPIV